MNIGGLAMQAFGGAVKELDGKGKEDVRAVFRQVWFSDRSKMIQGPHRTTYRPDLTKNRIKIERF